MNNVKEQETLPTIRDFQKRIEELYLKKDQGRGWQETFIWFVEEVGELGRALRSEGPEQIKGELADVLAWLTTLASLFDVDMQQVAWEKYGQGCPKCHLLPCTCQERSRKEE